MQRPVVLVALGASAILSGCAAQSAETVQSPAPQLTSASSSAEITSAPPEGASPTSRMVTKTRVVTKPGPVLTSYLTPSVTQSESSTAQASSSSRNSQQSEPNVVVADSDIVQAGPYGGVQIQVVFVDGFMTEIVMLKQPDSSSRSRDISNGVFPSLIDSVLTTQSADIGIAGVSGASYSYAAFKQALQSVLLKIG